MASELYAAAYSYDYATTVRQTINKILERQVEVTLYTDSESLIDGFVDFGTKTEKRLLIDLRMIREAYEQGELTEIVWMPWEQNAVDAMTKENHLAALKLLLENNRLV